MGPLLQQEFSRYVLLESAYEELQVSLFLAACHFQLDFVLGLLPSGRWLFGGMLNEWEFGSLSASHELKQFSFLAAGADYVFSCHC